MEQLLQIKRKLGKKAARRAMEWGFAQHIVETVLGAVVTIKLMDSIDKLAIKAVDATMEAME